MTMYDLVKTLRENNISLHIEQFLGSFYDRFQRLKSVDCIVQYFWLTQNFVKRIQYVDELLSILLTII